MKLERFKINKNIFEFYSNNNLLKKQYSNRISLNKQKEINNSISSNNKIISKIFNSSSGECSSTLYKSNHRFDIQSLKINPSFSFNIKSSYKNINLYYLNKK